MQIKTLLVTALLPLGLLANPLPEAADDAPIVDLDWDQVTPAESPLEARARIVRPQYCAIVRATTVNCRHGPSTKYRVKFRLHAGNSYPFWCVHSGQCVTANGLRNCGWHYIKEHKCFVSGHYTDGRCTRARLGKCVWRNDDSGVAKPFN